MASQLLYLKLLPLLIDAIDTTYINNIHARQLVLLINDMYLSALSPIQIWCTETSGSFCYFAATIAS